MAILAPFKRTVRPFVVGGYQPRDGGMSYVQMPSYAENPRAYIRGFITLQRDIRDIYEYIEPSDISLDVYSDRIGRLLTIACFEVESNFKAILRENGFSKDPGSLSMIDYKRIEASHRLSQYEVLLPEWAGKQSTVKPFASWKDGSALKWYHNYNKYKHDRVQNAELANFRNLIDAWCGVFVVLSSQFFDSDFSVDAQVIG
jgi:hypothetical protein